MAAKIIDGEAVAGEMLAALRNDIATLTAAGKPPCLAAIRANGDAGSAWYAKAQREHCAAHGVGYVLDDLGHGANEAAVLEAIRRRNADPAVAAILLHMPLPVGADYLKLVSAILPEKDAEGVHPRNLGALLATGRSDPAPCTAMSAFELVRRTVPELNGARALVLGRSAIVGKPAALLLLNVNASVTIGHSRSDVKALAREAEVIVAATGAAAVKWNKYEKAFAAWKRAGGQKPPPPDLTPLVTADMVRRGAVVIDIGVNHVPKGFDDAGEPLKNKKGEPAMQYAGDVDFEAVKEVAGHITAPRGGAGPVTNAFLLQNTVRAARRAAGRL